LRREGVGTASILRGGARLGLYFVEPGADLRTMRVVYDRTGSALAEIEPGAIDWTRVLAGAGWFHSTGITPALGDGPAAALARAIACARAEHVPVSLDLNYREALWRGRDPRGLVEPLARQADVLIGNREAVRALLGVEAPGGGTRSGPFSPNATGVGPSRLPSGRSWARGSMPGARRCTTPRPARSRAAGDTWCAWWIASAGAIASRRV